MAGVGHYPVVAKGDLPLWSVWWKSHWTRQVIRNVSGRLRYESAHSAIISTGKAVAPGEWIRPACPLLGAGVFSGCGLKGVAFHHTHARGLNFQAMFTYTFFVQGFQAQSVDAGQGAVRGALGLACSSGCCGSEALGLGWWAFVANFVILRWDSLSHLKIDSTFQIRPRCRIWLIRQIGHGVRFDRRVQRLPYQPMAHQSARCRKFFRHLVWVRLI